MKMGDLTGDGGDGGGDSGCTTSMDGTEWGSESSLKSMYQEILRRTRCDRQKGTQGGIGTRSGFTTSMGRAAGIWPRGKELLIARRLMRLHGIRDERRTLGECDELSRLIRPTDSSNSQVE